ncbi:MAG TPA: sigma-70 family RNA polymerase sigma factor [Gemmataceae bacterium]|nr:sigma-70 family RNA polymerase sigma factor [Gemmataceae bacterium]
MPPRSALLGQLFRLASPPSSDAELLLRWVDRRDEDAFAALVSRHGRMVHGVCRRILGNSHDADDAFQAVFLILARKAAGLRQPEALSGWIHGVAVRLACKARAATRRRCAGTDSIASEPRDPHPDPLDALSARELLGLIDREIARLPEVYRLPLVLCDLEERTQPEAARLLGWTLGSFRGRLLRGRERLRARLSQRGIAGAALVAALAQGSADAAPMTANLTRLAVRFSSCPTSTEVPPSVAALVREGIRGLMMMKLKLASIVLLAAGTLVAGVGLLAWTTPAPQPQGEERAESKPPAPPQNAKPQVHIDQAGDPLPAEAISRLGTIRFRHGGAISSIVFTPDGKSLVSCGIWDGIRIWDTASGKQIRRLAIETAGDRPLSVSPDGKLMAILVRTKTPQEESIALHEFATGRLVRRFGKENQGSALLFSPDGKTLASYRWPHTVNLWDSATGRLLHTLKGHKDNVWAVAFSADGKTLVSGSDDKTIRFWDVGTGKQLRQINHKNGVGVLALSSDGKFLATIDVFKKVQEGGGDWPFDDRVRLWEVATGKETRQLILPAKESTRDESRAFQSLAFTPDGKVLLTGGTDGILRFWDPASGNELQKLSGFAGCPGMFAFAPDGKKLAVEEGFAMIRLLDLVSGKDLLPTPGHRSHVSSIVVTSDCQTVVTTGRDGTLRFWDAATGRERQKRTVHASFLIPPQFLPDGTTYLESGGDKMFHLHDLVSGKELAILRGHEAGHPLALSPDRKTLASAKDNKEVCLLDPATGAVRHKLTKVKHHVLGMSFSADGNTLVVWDANQIVTVWDVATGKKRRQFTGPTVGGVPVLADSTVYYTAALSPDGKLLAFGLQGFDPQAKQGILPILDTTTGKEVCRFRALGGGAEIFAFSPDGRTLAWSGWIDNTIYLGEIPTGRVRRRFTGHLKSVDSLAFSRDSKMLVSGGNDTTALVWDLTGRLAMEEKYGAALSPEELATHWKTLAAEDAEAVFRVMQALVADPSRSVPYFRARLYPIAPADEKRLQQWIADLDSDQFAVREKATSELEKLGAAAVGTMQKALEAKPALETRRRLEQLIDKQEREEWPASGERLRIWRALEVLERIGTPEAREVLTTLANGAPGARPTVEAKAALQRLAQRPGR